MLILYVKNILSRLYGTWLLRKQGHSVYQQTHSTFNSQHSRRYIDHRTVHVRCTMRIVSQAVYNYK